MTVDTARAGRIRERRLAAGLSQDRLARLARCSVSMVLSIERGYVPQRSAVLPRVERALDAYLPPNEQRPGTTPTAAAKADDPGPRHAA
jgi:transcriptional regulator with XRE-family HTH domain